MSYILDALKRAERERRAGQTSLLDEPLPGGPEEAPAAWLRWRVPAAVAALLLAGFAASLIFGRRTPATRAAAAVSAAAPPVAVAPGPVPATTPAAPTPAASPAPPPAAVQAQTVPAPTASIEDQSAIGSLDDLAADDDSAAAHAATPASAPARVSAPPAPHANPATTAPASTAPANTTSAAATPDDTEPDAAAADTANPPPQDTAAPDLHQLKEMPDDYRAQFPAFTVDVHAYNENPAQRFVLVGGKRYREGDTLAQGPRIVGIVPEGLVLDWRGEKVLYALTR